MQVCNKRIRSSVINGIRKWSTYRGSMWTDLVQSEEALKIRGKMKRARPRRKFMDVMKEDMAEVEVTEEDTEDRNNWRWKIRCGDP